MQGGRSDTISAMVLLSAPTFREDDEHLVASTRLQMRWPGKEVDDQIWFKLPKGSEVTPEAVADASFSFGMILAMASGSELRMDAPVSPRLLDSSVELQDILANWFPRKLTKAELHVEPRTAPGPTPTNGTLSFFSGGVDSFYTAVTPPDRVTALVLIHGFDIRLRDKAFFAHTLERLQAAAADLGRPLVQLATNLRHHTNYRGGWGPIYHGVALGAVSALMHPHGDTVLVPGSYTYSQLHPWGSHPLTDRLRSTEYMEVVHDGAGASRVDKIIALSDNPMAQRHVRVCWEREGPYNCGECEKCLRTMTTLQLIGALEKFEVFPQTFSAQKVRDMQRVDEYYMTENLRLAKRVGDEELTRVLRQSLRRYRREKAARTAPAPLPPKPSPITLRRRVRKRLRSLERRIASLSRRRAVE